MDEWRRKGVPVIVEKPVKPPKKKPPVTRPLTPEEIEACEAILAGETPRVAFRRETGKKSDAAFRRFMKNGEQQAYMAARRMELRVKMGDDEDPGERWLRAVTSMAYWDPGEFVSEPLRGPQDIARLPEHVRLLITGWSYDKDGRFVVKFFDRKSAMDMLARYHGLYQADRVNDKDSATNLLATVFWRYVMALHLHRGITIAEAHVEARRDPDAVEAWGRARGLLTAKASGDVGE